MDNKHCELSAEGKSKASPTRSIQEPLCSDKRLMGDKKKKKKEGRAVKS